MSHTDILTYLKFSNLCKKMTALLNNFAGGLYL